MSNGAGVENNILDSKVLDFKGDEVVTICHRLKIKWSQIVTI